MSSKTVLIVEDNEDNYIICRTMLEYRGLTVLRAADGITGLDLAKRHKPDVILMDVSIPGLDGWESTRRLKADADTASIPVVILTAHALATDRLRATEVGADSYLAKPIEPAAVYEEVLRAMR